MCSCEFFQKPNCTVRGVDDAARQANADRPTSGRAAEFVRNRRSSRKSADSDSVVFNTQLDVSSLSVCNFALFLGWLMDRQKHKSSPQSGCTTYFWLPPFDKRCSLQVDGPPKSAQVEPTSYHRKWKWKSVKTNSQSSLWNYFKKKKKVHCRLPCKASKW